jgi:threonine synthase
MERFQRTGALAPEGQPGTPFADPVIRAGRGDTAATLATIRAWWRDYGTLLDPHTAVGVHVAGQHLDPDAPMICLATAHPAKFGDAIRQATGEDLAHHATLDALCGAPTRVTRVPATRTAVAEFIAREIDRTRT